MPKGQMTKKNTAIQLKLDPNKPESKFKLLGGGKADEWNDRLSNLTVNALPIAHSKNKESVTEACFAVSYGVMDMAPTDPLEGILIAQLMAANEAALTMYRQGWAQPPEYFQARTKYLQLADKAARTVMMLTERLDHHRGRGQQQITVKHVTTNNVTADQAIIADSVTTGAGRSVASPALLAASSVTPMPILDEVTQPDPEEVGRGGKAK
jgi:hypothetical protein